MNRSTWSLAVLVGLAIACFAWAADYTWPAGARLVVAVDSVPAKAGPSAEVVLLDSAALPKLEAGWTWEVFDSAGRLVPLWKSADQLCFSPRPKQARYLVAAVPERDFNAPALKAGNFPLPDYAAEIYGDAWDFDEGDLEGIRQQGDKPGYIRLQASDGVLHVHVGGPDPWFLWGVMWGYDPQAALKLDSRRYHLFRLCLKQDVQKARWQLYATDEQGKYEVLNFTVKGTGWQTVEFDLRKVWPSFWDGRTIAAFRLDPTNDLKQAEIAIDYVEILRDTQALLGPVYTKPLLEQVRLAAAAVLEPVEPVKAGQPAVLKARALDASGKPLPYGLLRCRVTAALSGVQARRGKVLESASGIVLLEADETGSVEAALSGPVKSGTYLVQVAPCDAAGAVIGRWVERALKVESASPAKVELLASPAGLGQAVDEPDFKVKACLEDAYGNRVEQAHVKVEWSASPGIAFTRVERTTDEQGLAEADCRWQGKPGEYVQVRAQVAGSKAAPAVLEKVFINYRKRHLQVLPNGYLAWRDTGKVFFPLGGLYANWPAQGLQDENYFKGHYDLFPCDAVPFFTQVPFTPKVKQMLENYFAYLHSCGVNSLRLMLRNMDLVGAVDEAQLEAVKEEIQLALKQGLYTTVVLFDDYTKPPYVNQAVLEKVVLPHYTEAQLQHLPPWRKRFLVEKRLVDREPARGVEAGSVAWKYLDEDALKCQEAYLKQLLPELAATPGIIRYELENEMVNYSFKWINRMTALIRAIDPYTPVVGDPGGSRYPVPLEWAEQAQVDCFEYHPYTSGEAGFEYGVVQDAWALEAQLAQKAFMTGEGHPPYLFWDKAKVKDEVAEARRALTDQLWLSLLQGACGGYKWPDPFASELKEFASAERVAEQVDFAHFQPHQPDLWLKFNTRSVDRKVLDEWCRYCLKKGLSHRLLAPGAEAPRGAYVVETSTFATPQHLRRRFLPSKGYQLKYLLSKDGTTAILYLRNCAGVQEVGKPGHKVWLRQVQPALAAFTFNLPGGTYSAWVRDLDAGAERTLHVQPGQQVRLASTSEHDFVVILKKQ